MIVFIKYEAVIFRKYSRQSQVRRMNASELWFVKEFFLWNFTPRNSFIRAIFHTAFLKFVQSFCDF